MGGNGDPYMEKIHKNILLSLFSAHLYPSLHHNGKTSIIYTSCPKLSCTREYTGPEPAIMKWYGDLIAVSSSGA